MADTIAAADAAPADAAADRPAAHADGVDDATRRAAEREMKRSSLPDDAPAAKRARTAGANAAGDAAGDACQETETGRFDYGATADLVAPGGGLRGGFLVTCDYRREQSATKEARAALQALLRPAAGGGAAEPAALPALKLSARGAVLLALRDPPGDGVARAAAAQAAVVRLVADVESGARPRLRHAGKVLPVSATAALTPEGIAAAAAAAAATAAPDLRAAAAAGRPPSFAIAYKPRGEKGAVTRDAAIKAAADAFTGALRAEHGFEEPVAVDLKAPEVLLAITTCQAAGVGVVVLASALPAAACNLGGSRVVKTVGPLEEGAAGGKPKRHRH